MLFVRFSLLLFFLVSLIASGSPYASAQELRNINFAIFQKVDDSFEFDPIVLGKFSSFIEAMRGSQVLLLSHTRNAIDGDVINIQQDVLRESSEGLNDQGINCSMTFRDHSTVENTDFELGGMCRLLDSLNSNMLAIIPMASLPDTEQGIEAWVEVYEDEASGVAFYANVSSGD